MAYVPGRRLREGAALRATPVLLVTLWLIWGSSFLFIKAGTDAAPPLVYAALRLGVAAAAMALVVALQRGPALPPEQRRLLHRYGLALGLLNGAVFSGLQTAGIDAADTGFSAVVIYTQPLLVAALARRVLGERLTRRQLVGLAAGWTGVALAGVAGLRLESSSAAGFALLLGAAACWAAGSLVVKRAPASLPLWPLLLWQNVYGAVPLAVVAVLVGGEVDWGPALYVSTLWVGTMSTAAGFALQFALLRRGQASVVSSWIFAVPVISGLLGVVVRDEALSSGLVVGAAAVAVAIWLVTPRTPSPAPAPAPAPPVATPNSPPG